MTAATSSISVTPQTVTGHDDMIQRYVDDIAASDQLIISVRVPRPYDALITHERITPRQYPITELNRDSHAAMVRENLLDYLLVGSTIKIANDLEPKISSWMNKMSVIPYAGPRHLTPESQRMLTLGDTDATQEETHQSFQDMLEQAVLQPKCWAEYFGNVLKHVLVATLGHLSGDSGIVKINKSGEPFRKYRISEFLPGESANLMVVGQDVITMIDRLIGQRHKSGEKIPLFLIKWPRLLPAMTHSSSSTIPITAGNKAKAAFPAPTHNLLKFQSRTWVIDNQSQLIEIGVINGAIRCPFSRHAGSYDAKGQATSGAEMVVCGAPVLKHPMIPHELVRLKKIAAANDVVAVDPAEDDEENEKPNSTPKNASPAVRQPTPPDSGDISTSLYGHTNNESSETASKFSALVHSIKGTIKEVQEMVTPPETGGPIVGSNTGVNDSILAIYSCMKPMLLNSRLSYTCGDHCPKHMQQIENASIGEIMRHPLMSSIPLPKAVEYYSLDELKVVLNERLAMEPTIILKQQVNAIRMNPLTNKEGDFQMELAAKVKKWADEQKERAELKRKSLRSSVGAESTTRTSISGPAYFSMNAMQRQKKSRARNEYYLDNEANAQRERHLNQVESEWQAMKKTVDQLIALGSTLEVKYFARLCGTITEFLIISEESPSHPMVLKLYPILQREIDRSVKHIKRKLIKQACDEKEKELMAKLLSKKKELIKFHESSASKDKPTISPY